MRAAALLIGVFVPMNLSARVLPIGWLLSVTGNAHNILFVDQIGSAIGVYEFFGFPGLGLLLGWLLLVRLERADHVIRRLPSLRLRAIVDLALSRARCCALGAALLLIVGPLHALARTDRRSRPAAHRVSGHGQIAQVFPRNGVNLFLERECSDFGGYFEQMWNVHFPAGRAARSICRRATT